MRRTMKEETFQVSRIAVQGPVLCDILVTEGMGRKAPPAYTHTYTHTHEEVSLSHGAQRRMNVERELTLITEKKTHLK